MAVLEKLSAWAQRIKRDAITLWFTCKHRETPWYAKALCLFTVAYALSPIDLIPDFIPVLGYVDDAILLPGLIWLAIRLIPPRVLAECRIESDKWMQRGDSKPRSYLGAAVIIALWCAFTYWCWTALVAPRFAG